MRILVAEDERDLNRILSERLRAEYYSVVLVLTGKRRWIIWMPQNMTQRF